MAIFNPAEKVKSIIVLALDVLTILFLGLVPIMGWNMPLWVIILDAVAAVVLGIFGITRVKSANES